VKTVFLVVSPIGEVREVTSVSAPPSQVAFAFDSPIAVFSAISLPSSL